MSKMLAYSIHLSAPSSFVNILGFHARGYYVYFLSNRRYVLWLDKR